MFNFQKFRKYSCPTCGIMFAIPKIFAHQKWEMNGTVYCPNGHTMHFKLLKEEEEEEEDSPK